MAGHDLAAIQAHLTNRLDPSAGEAGRVAGIIGDRPSQYAKSPSLWNAVFRVLDLDAIYLPFDVDESRLAPLVRTLRQTGQLLGFNVTVPFKVKIIEYLDGLEDKARQIGAVNTVARMEDGRLIGYNTDGTGFLQSLTTPLLPNEAPLLPDPRGVDVLIIGAGGAARAVAFFLAETVGSGRLVIANRTRATATALADEVNLAYGNASAIDEGEIGEVARLVGLVVNCSSKGQAGVRKLPTGRATILEPYSALAAASPAVFPDGEASAPVALARWFETSLPDIERNNQISAQVALRLPPSAVVYDLIYAPLETVFLRHCRLTGHRTANGKGMNIAQAVDALVDKVCRSYLDGLGLDRTERQRRVVEVMFEVW